ncbi:hypothetical protein G6F40_018176 [Rhizopus arrhizus]|nr:hypothetical protein G6F40_018176 [Rhizopus arrhizus]
MAALLARLRQGHGRGDAAGEVGDDRHAGLLTAGQAQALAQVLQADAGAAGALAEATAIVGHGHGDASVPARA